MDIDEHTLELCLATILAVAMVGSQPPFLGVIRMRRAERLLGWAYWPLLHTLDDRERRHKRIRRNDGVEFEQGFTPYHLALRARSARSSSVNRIRFPLSLSLSSRFSAWSNSITTS